jgi:hypothetical protein
MLLFKQEGPDMSDKRTGKKKKKVRPVVKEETPNPTAPETPVIVPKKTKKSSKS